MMKKPSQPDFLEFESLDAPGEGESLPGAIDTPRQSRMRPSKSSSSLQAFKDNISVIKGETGRLTLRKILPAQLSLSALIEKFPDNSRPEWVEIITDLMVTAKEAVETSMPVDFHVKLRQYKDDEDRKPVAQKLLFIMRLANALNGELFVMKNGQHTSTWKIARCSSNDLSAAAPSVLAIKDGGEEIIQVPLVQVMAGLKIS